MGSERLYRVIFHNQGKVYEVYARGVSDAGLMGFVEVEALVFGERSQVVVDPAEERLQSEFEGVERFYIPMHSVVRIDEVAKRGTARISDPEGKVSQFPSPFYPGRGGPKGD